MPDETSEWVRMRFPAIAADHVANDGDESDGDAVVKRTAFDGVWEPLGWEWVADEDDPNVGSSDEPEPERLVLNGTVTEQYADPQRQTNTTVEAPPSTFATGGAPDPFVPADEEPEE